MPRYSDWKPRASALGGYAACTYRAAQDRAIAEGLMDDPVEHLGTRASSPYADLGTVIHWHCQVVAGCTWPNNDDADLHIYTDEQVENAISVTPGASTPEEVIEHARRVAPRIVARLPPIDGNWKAESAFSNVWIQGHIDFLSEDKTLLVDLKTTTRMPGGKAKILHLWQQAAYASLVPTVRHIVILYADSRGQWVAPSDPIRIRDEDGEPVGHWLENVALLTRFLRTKKLYDLAFPSFGPHCDDGFCPYRPTCRDEGDGHIPRVREVFEHVEPPPTFNLNIFGESSEPSNLSHSPS